MQIVRKENRTLLANPDAFGSALLLVAFATYGEDVLDWAPETILMELNDDFKIDLPQESLDRLLAALMVVKGNNFQQSLPDFIDICNVLSGSAFRPDTFDPADIYEIAWAVVEASLIWPPDDEYSEEIIGYVAAAANQAGLTSVPRCLSHILTKEMLRQPDTTLFEEDPIMFNAGFDLKQSHADDVDAIVAGNLFQLQDQLDGLKLEIGSTEDAINRTLETLTKNTE